MKNEIMLIYKNAYKQLLEKRLDTDVLYFGPSHIVWEDGNYIDAEWCINHFKNRGYKFWDNYTREEIMISIKSLKQLTQIPMRERRKYQNEKRTDKN